MERNDPLIVAEIIQTCSSCPSQWEGTTTCGLPFYIRYRWGHLSVSIAKPGECPVSGKEIFGKQIGDGFDGCLSEEELFEQISGVLKKIED